MYWVATVLTNKLRPQPGDVARMEVRRLEDVVIEEAIEEVESLYEDSGANDQVAKGSELREAVVRALAGRVQGGAEFV